MQQKVIRLVGPGGAGKTTTGARLAEHLGGAFIDLDERFAATHGNISEYLNAHGYTSYAMQNVHTYLDVMEASAGSRVLALSSGFMTYSPDVHPDYARARDEIAASPTTLVLLPSLDYDTCVTETVRRQLGRPFCRSAEREEEVIRQRFGVYRSLSAVTLQTMKPIPEVVETAVMHLLPHLRLDVGGARW
jgi:shikimate kinase